jgi:threonine dehydrogenase-like Zn-dependent dehydrogenase
LTDAGVTPYRGIKKLPAAGVLGPDRVMAVFGASGLGSCAVQYAKLFSSGSTVVVFARSEEKLAIAKERGADYTINTRGKSLSDLRYELVKLVGKSKLDSVIDSAAVKAANASQFGLSGNLWTKDVELARKIARDLYTGGVFINGVTLGCQSVELRTAGMAGSFPTSDCMLL